MPRHKRPTWVSRLCQAAGIALLVGVVALCAPLTVPRIAGYEIYDVVSGSMEPQIPVGSVLYVKSTDLTQIPEGDVIAFRDGDVVVAHRVVYNRTTLGEFVTKGDANNTEDREPIPYDQVIGRVQMHVPFLGTVLSMCASTMGKVYLLLIAGCGLMLCKLADQGHADNI